MDASIPLPRLRFVPMLPYWAVLQTDLRQTIRGWVWRTWVMTSVLAAVGYLLYRLGVYREAGIVQHASTVTGDLLRWPLLGTVLLVVVLAVSAMTAGSRGTLADAVLSRGISRRQYFMAKLHSRLASVLITFITLTALVLTVSHYMLHEDLSFDGCAIGLMALASILTLIITCGVAIGAMVSTTVFGVSIVWLGLYAAAFGLSLLPSGYSTPDRLLAKLPQILAGQYDSASLTSMIWAALSASLIVALLGMMGFSRSDV